MQHKLAVVSTLTLLALGLASLLAPQIGSLLGQDFQQQNIFYRYQPILSHTLLPFEERERLLEEFFQSNPGLMKKVSDHLSPANFDEDLVFEYILEKGRPLSGSEFIQLNQLIKSFQRFHLFGTDELGRDVFTRLIYAGRVSIGIGLLVAIIAGLLSLAIGSMAGFYGGKLDIVLMRFTDLMMSIPIIPVLIVLTAIDIGKTPLHLFSNSEHQELFKVVFILSLFSWMTGARVVRASIHSVKRLEFVTAAKGLGASNIRVLMSHVLPNVLGPFLVAQTVVVAQAILIEAGLSFLGLGIQPPTPSWGNMLSNAQELIYESPHLAVMPGLLIFIVVASINFMGDAVNSSLQGQKL